MNIAELTSGKSEEDRKVEWLEEHDTIFKKRILLVTNPLKENIKELETKVEDLQNRTEVLLKMMSEFILPREQCGGCGRYSRIIQRLRKELEVSLKELDDDVPDLVCHHGND
jgi:hypothetical protein